VLYIGHRSRLESAAFLPVCFRGAAAGADTSHTQQVNPRSYKHMPLSDLSAAFATAAATVTVTSATNDTGTGTRTQKYDTSLLSLIQMKYASTLSELLAVLNRCVCVCVCMFVWVCVCDHHSDPLLFSLHLYSPVPTVLVVENIGQYMYSNDSPGSSSGGGSSSSSSSEHAATLTTISICSALTDVQHALQALLAHGTAHGSSSSRGSSTSDKEKEKEKESCRGSGNDTNRPTLVLTAEGAGTGSGTNSGGRVSAAMLALLQKRLRFTAQVTVSSVTGTRSAPGPTDNGQASPVAALHVHKSRDRSAAAAAGAGAVVADGADTVKMLVHLHATCAATGTGGMGGGSGSNGAAWLSVSM